MKAPASLCVNCKGTKKLCGLDICPILTRIKSRYAISTKLSASIAGPSNEVFVGSHGYPYVAVGPLVGLGQAPLPPQQLYLKNYEEIISHRLNFVRGKRFISVNERMQTEIQEIGLSIKPVESEMELTKIPNPSIFFSSELQPMGPSAPIKRFKQSENPKIPKKVDAIIGENLLASDAIRELSNAGFNNYYLTNVFATGALGKVENKKTVPTKWSITALHDIMAKQWMNEVRRFEQINEIFLFYHYSLGNSYFVLLIPGSWEFENFESWSPKSVWAQDAKEMITTREYEPFWGRTTYAEKQVGGYYASRFSVVQHLYNMRKQARVVVIREIDETYVVPIGVFQVQEGVRSALNSHHLKFDSLKEALGYVSSKTRVEIKKYLQLSNILNQSRLISFF